jgi:hypothetical protein
VRRIRRRRDSLAWKMVLLVEQNARTALKLARRGYVIELGRTVLEGEKFVREKARPRGLSRRVHRGAVNAGYLPMEQLKAAKRRLCV